MNYLRIIASLVYFLGASASFAMVEDDSEQEERKIPQSSIIRRYNTSLNSDSDIFSSSSSVDLDSFKSLSRTLEGTQFYDSNTFFDSSTISFSRNYTSMGAGGGPPPPDPHKLLNLLERLSLISEDSESSWPPKGERKYLIGLLKNSPINVIKFDFEDHSTRKLASGDFWKNKFEIIWGRAPKFEKGLPKEPMKGEESGEPTAPLTKPLALSDLPGDMLLHILCFLPTEDYMGLGEVSRAPYNLTRHRYAALEHLKSIADNLSLLTIKSREIEGRFRSLGSNTYFLTPTEKQARIAFESDFAKDIKSLRTIINFYKQLPKKKLPGRPSLTLLFNDNGPLGQLAQICASSGHTIHPNFLEHIQRLIPKLDPNKIGAYRNGGWRTRSTFEPSVFQLPVFQIQDFLVPTFDLVVDNGPALVPELQAELEN
jgi:hypothetical protein